MTSTVAAQGTGGWSKNVDQDAVSTGANSMVPSGELSVPRSRYTAIRRFFSKPKGRLTPLQKVEVERRLLEALARRAAYWVGILLIASVGVAVFGAYQAPGHYYDWSVPIWGIGLWLLALPYLYLLAKVVGLPEDVTATKVRQLHIWWCIWITASAFWWMAGNWALSPQPPPDREHPAFVLAQGTFVWLTLIGHVLTLLLLAPSRIAVLSVLGIGIFVPFFFGGIANHMWNPKMAAAWFGSHLVVYCLIGWFLYLDQRRIHARGVLLEAERARANHFIAAISHDLRQPLTTLALKLKSLKTRVSTPEVLAGIEEAQQQTLAMESMVNGTLDLSRLEAGTWEVRLREVALPQLMENVVSNLAADARAKHIALELHTHPYLVRSDPLALERILRNLLVNALRYTPTVGKDGSPGRVLVACEVRDERMCISVEDNGIGIQKNKREDIFKAYVQLANPERDRSKGLGLGLSIVKGLADVLGHKLEVDDSTLGQGSRFSVLVPIVGRIPPELLMKTESTSSTPDLTGMVVVLVEDEQGPRDALRERLVEWGCYVVEGESAEEVIGKLQSEDLETGPHFVLSDYRLREGKTGIAAIDAIRAATGATLPAAIWSAETAATTLQQVAAKGLAMLSKPPDETALLALLEKHRPSANSNTASVLAQ
jgi:two-component system, sensor histidine kinase